MTNSIEKLKEIIKIMKEEKIQSLNFKDDHMDTTIELHSSNFVAESIVEDNKTALKQDQEPSDYDPDMFLGVSSHIDFNKDS